MHLIENIVVNMAQINADGDALLKPESLLNLPATKENEIMLW